MRRPWTLMNVAFEMSYSSTLIRPLCSPSRLRERERKRSIIPRTSPVHSRAEINVSELEEYIEREYRREILGKEMRGKERNIG